MKITINCPAPENKSLANIYGTATQKITLDSSTLDKLVEKWQTYKDLVNRAGLQAIEFNL